jgi:hypothetical protein
LRSRNENVFLDRNTLFAMYCISQKRAPLTTLLSRITASESVTDASCPLGWKNVMSLGCFLFSQSLLSADDAWAYCKLYRSKLANVDLAMMASDMLGKYVDQASNYWVMCNNRRLW